MRDRRVPAGMAIAAGVAVFAAGLLIGAYGIGSAGQAPCSQVTADLQDAQDTLASTFGGGEEGRAASAEVLAAMQDRPDCFPPGAAARYRRAFEGASAGATDTASESISEP